MSKAATTLLQTALRDLGYQPGPIDGLVGPKTLAAGRAWLDAQGAPVSDLSRPPTAAVIYQGAARHPVHEIVIHCAATRPGWMADRPLAEKRAEIRRWHMSAPNHWRDIGYHWLIDRDGAVVAGRAETEVGAGVAGRNSGVIHICLIGGHGSSERDRFSQHFTRAQDMTLRELIRSIGERTQLRRIAGHNEFAAKACPGFQVAQWLKETSW